MEQTQQFELWFRNQSLSAGQAVVYQSTGNVSVSSAPLLQLAWMVAAANPSVYVNFSWTLGYNFVWSNVDDEIASEQVIAADPDSTNQVTLSFNQNGFTFGTPTASTQPGSLLIAEDASVPVESQAITGIGMSGAGTFALTASPNTNLMFTPTASTALTYLITFGTYGVETGDVIPGTLNPPGTVAFPQGVTTMTATLSANNSWTITSGPPPSARDFIEYRAGVGVVSGADGAAAGGKAAFHHGS